MTDGEEGRESRGNWTGLYTRPLCSWLQVSSLSKCVVAPADSPSSPQRAGEVGAIVQVATVQLDACLRTPLARRAEGHFLEQPERGPKPVNWAQHNELSGVSSQLITAAKFIALPSHSQLWERKSSQPVTSLSSSSCVLSMASAC